MYDDLGYASGLMDNSNKNGIGKSSFYSDYDSFLILHYCIWEKHHFASPPSYV